MEDGAAGLFKDLGEVDARRFEHYEPEDEMILNMGPQHPSTHGVLNFIVFTDGEVIRKAVPDIGYLHRSIEKIGETVTWPGFMPYTDRVDYVAAMTANEGYAMAVEKLMGLVVPKRAHYCRAIASELGRIASHLIALGAIAMDIGAVTPFLWCIGHRERVNDLLEELCGARLTFNYVRIGGVSWDVPDGYAEKTNRFIDEFLGSLEEFQNLISNNPIFVERLRNVAIITREEAIDYNLAGPNLRSSGVDWDLRRDMPYSVYPELSFRVPVGQGWAGTVGDSYDRFYSRFLEVQESARMVSQCLVQMEPGEVMAKVPRNLKPPAGEAYARVESARGDMGYYVVSDGGPIAYRVRARTGSFAAMGIIEAKSRGLMVADLVAFIASLDVVAPEIDR
jgi:NADH-quinone oxidoreductase subunit D